MFYFIRVFHFKWNIRKIKQKWQWLFCRRKRSELKNLYRSKSCIKKWRISVDWFCYTHKTVFLYFRKNSPLKKLKELLQNWEMKAVKKRIRYHHKYINKRSLKYIQIYNTYIKKINNKMFDKDVYKNMKLIYYEWIKSTVEFMKRRK